MAHSAIAALWLLLIPSLAFAWPATVVDVHDGDTITVRRDDGTQHRVRLYGIDAPELAQPGGTEARDHLRALLASATVDVRPVATDRYGRTVARVHRGDSDINRAMIVAGHAWVYSQYCRTLAPCALWHVDDVMAAHAGRGLWAAPDPQPPWEWRRMKRQE